MRFLNLTRVSGFLHVLSIKRSYSSKDEYFSMHIQFTAKAEIKAHQLIRAGIKYELFCTSWRWCGRWEKHLWREGNLLGKERRRWSSLSSWAAMRRRGDVSRRRQPPADFSGRGEFLQDQEIEVGVRRRPTEE
jgi:hypothetical protein